MKTQLLLTFLLLFILASSCQDSNEKTSTADITFIKRGAETLVDSSVLIMNFHYKDGSGKHLLDAAERIAPLNIVYYESLWDTLGIFYKTLGTFRIGDSVHFNLTARQWYVETNGDPRVPNELSLSDTSKIYFFVGITNQMPLNDFYAREDSLEQQGIQDYIDNTDERKASQASQINQYLDQLGLAATTLESGLTYVITEEGTGTIPTSGDWVTIHYEGSLLDGHVFGTSHEEKSGPFEFESGIGDVIRAWDEAATIFKVGTKAILLVPSDLGFGYHSYPDIPSSSILRYDIEIVKSRTAN